jgi:hypothetical protein
MNRLHLKLIRNLKVLLTLLCLFCGSTLVSAQDYLLEKQVNLKSINNKLDKVLDELSRDGAFQFSYQSDILDKDRVVTLKNSKNTLSEVLSMMLGKEYEFLETGNYVIIRKRDFNKEYVLNGVDGERRLLNKKKLNYQPNQEDKIERRETVRHIIDDLVTEKIIPGKESLVWFGLDDHQFIVNDKPQPDSLFTQFRSKYVKSDGMGYYYGPVKISGRGYFLDKSDLE